MIRFVLRARWAILVPALLLTAGAAPSVRPAAERVRPTAILAPLATEGESIRERIADKDVQTILGIRFTTGRLEGRPVVYAVTGAGKVNAATATALLLDHFQPAEVILTGVAGGLSGELEPGDVVIAERLAQHDLGAVTSTGFEPRGVRNPSTGKPNPILLPCDPNLVEAARRASGRRALVRVDSTFRPPKVTVGTIVSGDIFIASSEKRADLRKTLKADAVEMEGAAVAQVCYQQQVPFLVIRGLSDSADDKAYTDFGKMLRTAVQNASGLTMELVAELNGASTPTTAP
jgi:adenosylhomocysteine nucleosidase